jgi:hypothetical protein
MARALAMVAAAAAGRREDEKVGAGGAGCGVLGSADEIIRTVAFVPTLKFNNRFVFRELCAIAAAPPRVADRGQVSSFVQTQRRATTTS